MSDRYLRTWTTREVLEEVITVVVDQVGLPRDEVTPASALGDDLGTDSLDDVEILMAAEEAFGLDLPEAQTRHIRTVAELTAVVTRQLGKRVVAG